MVETIPPEAMISRSAFITTDHIYKVAKNNNYRVKIYVTGKKTIEFGINHYFSQYQELNQYLRKHKLKRLKL